MKIFITCIWMVLLPWHMQGQGDSDINNENGLDTLIDVTTAIQSDTDTSSLRTVFINLNSKLDALIQENDKDILGSLSMVLEDITLYYKNETTGRKVKIDSIIINVQEGVIANIAVVAGKYIFKNNKSPIALTSKRFLDHRIDYLYAVGEAQRKSYAIVLQDVLKFVALKPYAPDDTVIILNRENPKLNYSKGVNINSILDLRIFTDALALFDNDDNGIFQIDARAKWFIHHNNISNRYAYWFRYLKTSLNFAKFGNSDYFVDISSYSRSNMLQKSWFTGEIGLNLFELGIQKNYHNRFYVDIGANISATKYRTMETVTTLDSQYAKNRLGEDSLYVTNTTNEVYKFHRFLLPNLYIESGLILKSSDNYGMQVGLRGMLNWSTQTRAINADANDMHFFLRPFFEGYFNPFNDVPGRMFVRVNYFLDTRAKAEHANNFMQVHIGYTTTLTAIKQ